MHAEKEASAASGRTWLVLTAIVLAAAAVRLWDLGGPSLWTDELYTLGFSSLSPTLLWSDWMVRETNPPLFYTLLAVWKSVFGEGEFALRSLAAMFGVLGIVAIFLVGRNLHSNGAGLWAAALAAVSAQQLQYSQFVRGYTLGFLAATLCILALLKLSRHWRAESPGGRMPWLILYSAAATVAFYTHTTFFILPVLANIYMTWIWAFRTRRRRREAIEWLAVNIGVLIACAWWIAVTLQQIQSGAEQIAWIEPVSVRDAAMKTAHVFATRSLEPWNPAIALLFAAFMAWGAWRLDFERRVLAAIIGVGAPLILFLVSLAQPVFMERTLYWAQSVYFPCLAVGALSLPIQRLRAPAAAVCVAILLVDAIDWRRTDYREPWREIAAALSDGAEPADAILTYSGDSAVNLGYYCARLGCGGASVYALEISARGREVLSDSFDGPLVNETNAAQLLSGHKRIWVMQRGFEQNPETVLKSFAREEEPNVLSAPAPAAEDTLPVNYMELSAWRPAVRP